jgi:hypothetical protein
MAILEIAGKRVEVGPEFLALSPDQQAIEAEHIFNTIGQQEVAKQSEHNAINSVTPTAGMFDAPASIGAEVPKAEITDQSLKDMVNQNYRERNDLNDPATYKLQQMAKAPLDIVGAPVDLSSLLGNTALWGADKVANLFGGNVDTRIPASLPGSSDWLNQKRISAEDAIGHMTGAVPEDQSMQISPNDVSAQDRLLGTGLRFGTGALLAGGALAAKNAAAPAESGILATMEAPYAVNPSKALMGDALAGTTAGVTSEGYNEYVPDWLKEKLGPLGQIAAALMGAHAGATINSAGHALVDSTISNARDFAADKFGMFTDPSTPVNPATNKAFKPSEMDMAARIAQNMPTDTGKTVANLEAAKQDFGQFANADQMPTTGMLANDIGMSLNEKVARTKNPQRFAESDAARNALASDKIKSTVPAQAESQDMVNAMTRQYDDTLGAARNKLETARVAEAQGTQDINAQNAMLEEARRRQPERSTALDTEFRNQNEAATAEKNALYDAVPQNTAIDGADISAALDDINATVPRAAQQGTDYANALGRIRGLVQQVDPETGEMTFRDLTYGDLKVLKTDVGAMRKDAVAAGRDVTQIDKLNAMLADRIDAVNPQAAANYANNFAPRFRTGKAGEYSQQLKRAVKTGDESSATRPSEFAQKFLAKPEDANSLQRAIDVNGNPVTAQNATEWMLGDLAKSNVLNGNGELRYDRMRQWARDRQAVIDQFPALRQRVDQELARADQGGRLSRQLAMDVQYAQQNLGMTEDTLRRSALQHAIGNDPENTIASIMGSGDPAKKMGDLVARLSGDQKATDGLKAAVRDWITGRASTTGKNVGFPDTEKFSRAALDRLFAKHEQTLAKVYTPEEMNSLRQAHKLLDVAANLDVKVTGGSDTFQNFLSAAKDTSSKRWRMIEAATKAHYGVLKGGGVTRTLRLFADAIGSMSTKTQDVEHILTDLWFNPDLAQHLLTRNVKEIGTPAWNARLNKLLAAASGNRQPDSVENNDQKRSTEVGK